jgi:hypothetical protein
VQFKALSEIAVSFCQDPKDFESAMDIFENDALRYQCAITLSVRFTKVFASGFLVKGLTIRVQLDYSLIAFLAYLITE